MVENRKDYQRYKEYVHQGRRSFQPGPEDRQLSVRFVRKPDGTAFGKWTKKDTDSVRSDGPPNHPQLFIVCGGGKIEDEGAGNIYVSGPHIHFPQMVSRPEGCFIGRLAHEHHTLRHGDTLECCTVMTSHGEELRACGGVKKQDDEVEGEDNAPGSEAVAGDIQDDEAYLEERDHDMAEEGDITEEDAMPEVDTAAEEDDMSQEDDEEAADFED